MAVPTSHSKTCIDLTQYSTVFDLSCSFSHRKEFYHRIVNCILPLTPLLLHAEQSVAAAILVPDYLSVLVHALFNFTNAAVFIFNITSCFNVANATRLLYEAEGFHTAVFGSNRPFAEYAGRLLQQHAQQKFNSRSGINDVPRALIVRRNGSRQFCNFSSDILPPFQRYLRGFAVDVYSGNEEAPQFISLFARASIIFGYHGAGLANIVFSKLGAIIVEFGLLDGFVDSATGIYRRSAQQTCRILPGLLCGEVGVELESALNLSEQQRFRDLVSQSKNLTFPVNDHRHPANNFLHQKTCIGLSKPLILNTINAVRVSLRAVHFALENCSF
jgi:hypothetical protein